MRFSILAFTAAIAVATAQDLSAFPTCALSCFATAVPASGCSLTDFKCQCTTGKDKIEASITSCVPSKCSADDVAKIIPAVQKLCASAGITISDLPTALSSAASGASMTASASMTSSKSGTSASGAAASSTGSAPAEASGAAVANAAGLGAMAMGLAAMIL